MDTSNLFSHPDQQEVTSTDKNPAEPAALPNFSDRPDLRPSTDVPWSQ